MSDASDDRAPHGREQPWSYDTPEHGRVVVVTDNPIGRAVVEIARVVGRRATMLADEDVEQSPMEWLTGHPLDGRDALVLCDHDTPGMDELLRHALHGRAGYVAMMGSRRRAEKVFCLWLSPCRMNVGPVARAGGSQHRWQGARGDRTVGGRRDRRGVVRPRRRSNESNVGSPG